MAAVWYIKRNPVRAKLLLFKNWLAKKIKQNRKVSRDKHGSNYEHSNGFVYNKYLRGYKIKYGLINKSVKVVLKPIFDKITYCWGGHIWKTKNENKFGLVNLKGRQIVKPKYDYIGNFSEGLAIVEINKKYGYINKSGKIVIKPIFRSAREFSEGLASVEILKIEY